MFVEKLGRIGFVAAGIVVTGCAPAPVDPPGPANFRVANAEIGGLAFDVCWEGNVVLENSRFGGITDYAEVDSGSVTLEQAAAGSACDDVINEIFGGATSVSLDENSDNTLVLLADGESGFPLEDDNSPTPADRARVRVINGSEDSLSLTVTEAGGQILFPLVRYNEAEDADYIAVVAGSYDLVITPLSGDMDSIEVNDVELAEGIVYTLFAVGRIDGDGEAFELVVVEDASPGVEE